MNMDIPKTVNRDYDFLKDRMGYLFFSDKPLELNTAVSIAMGVPNSWMASKLENPNLTWMI